MNILFIGDIVGKGGRKAVHSLVPVLVRELDVDFVIANGENSAGGAGVSRRCINTFEESRVDVVTSGDHVWDQKEFLEEITRLPNFLRPANVFAGQPGNGFGVFNSRGGQKVGVINLLGRTFLNNQADCPFQCAERLVMQMKKQTPIIVVDMHAEATSEKIALGRFLDGRVSAVIGTHTHVPTADECIFPGGTAFHCDVGMVGARESVLGRAIKPVVQRFSTGMPARFVVVESGIRMHATLVSVDSKTGKALAITRVVRDFD